MCQPHRRFRFSLAAACLCALFALASCAGAGDESKTVRPRSMRDVPAARLLFHFEPDVGDESNAPEAVKDAESAGKIEAIQMDFETRRPDEELLRTVASPDGQRALALYATRETEGYDFRMDLYATSGAFIRNIFPPNLVGTFAEEVAWSPDGSQIAFIGIANPLADGAPAPDRETLAPPIEPSTDPLAAPTVAPAIAPVAAFKTEQIYIADRDGMNLRPLTTREGLIYFELAWSPDAHALAALACREDEWLARKDAYKAPGGRPRIIKPDGEERLLDDRLADAAPVWSPDSTKVATAFDKTVAIFDAVGQTPTGANIPLEEPLWAASYRYDVKLFGKSGDEGSEATRSDGGARSGDKDAAARRGEGESSEASNVLSGVSASQGEDAPTPPLGSVVLNSFNAIVRVAWPSEETVYAQTSFVRYLPNEIVPVVRYVRWHRITLQLPETAVETRK